MSLALDSPEHDHTFCQACGGKLPVTVTNQLYEAILPKQGMEYVTYSRRRVERMLSTKQIITNVILPRKFQRILQVEFVVIN